MSGWLTRLLDKILPLESETAEFVRAPHSRGEKVPPKPYKEREKNVEAIQVTPETVAEAEAWTGGRRVEEIDPNDDKNRFVGLNIPTQRGPARASQGDYVVKHADGNLEKVTEREFQKRFEMRECDG